MKEKTKRIKLLLVLLFLILIAGCKKKESFSLFSKEKKIISVKVYKVPFPKKVFVDLEYPGITRSYKEVLVCARITGTLEEAYFKEGDYVHKGDLLFEIEKDIYLAKYESAKAGYLQAKAQLEKAKKTWKRIKKSFSAHLVSEETRDSALAQLKLAEASLKLAEARLKEAEIFLNYTTIKAPISGITGQIMIDPGNIVAPGKPLVKIEQISPIYVEFSIPDNDLTKYNFLSQKSPNFLKFLKVKIKLGKKILKETGKIVFFASELGKGVPVLKVKALFQNSKKELLPNTFVRVLLKNILVKKAILVPQSCVRYSPEGDTVYVVENGKAVERYIKVEGTYKNYYLVSKGLKPGELVVANNLLKITSGSPVKVEKVIKR
jgi:membrane fusion protein (multidrug efflux system)